MRVLLAPVATPGFVFPLIAVAEALRSRGHEAAFVTDARFAAAIEARGFARLPRSAPDGPSFEIENWGDPVRIAIQAKHVERALDAYRPDAVLASNLAMGPLVARELHGVPTAVLGPIALLWGPPAQPASAHPARDARRAWRHGDQLAHLERARRAFGLPPWSGPFEASPLFGDRFLLQSVPELHAGERRPPAVRYVGSCVLPEIGALAGDDAAWIRGRRAAHRTLLYVQLGRLFRRESFWPYLERWLGERDAAAVVCVERYDGELGAHPDRVLVRDRIPQDAVLPHADAVVCGGQPTCVLGATRHGRPLLIVSTGSGTEDTAEAYAAYGAAVALENEGLTEERFRAALDDLLARGAYARAASRLGERFARYDGPAAVARELEELVAARVRVAEPA